MDWLSILLLALTFLAVMLVSGNNLSACVGPAVGSRVISKRFGMLLGAAGFSSGLLIQGSTMTHTVNALMPMATSQLRVEALAVSILVFFIANLIRAPVSLSMSLVGLFAGFSLASGLMTDSVYIAQVVGIWVAAPLISIVLAFYLDQNHQQETSEKFLA